MNQTTVRCSFCKKTTDEVRKMIAGPDVYICDECIDLCNDIIGTPVGRGARDEPVLPITEEPAVSERRKRVTEQIGELLAARDPRPRPLCSFCGKGRNEVRQLVEGPAVNICQECVRRSSESN